jgi:four helix bundle protein
MAYTHFRDLQVWQRSMALAETVYVVTKQFPKEELFGLISQLRRSAVSIPSNIAEGQGRNSDGNFALFLTQAQGSLYELETQIELSRNLKMMTMEQAQGILDEASAIGRMIHGLLGALRRSRAAVRQAKARS